MTIDDLKATCARLRPKRVAIVMEPGGEAEWLALTNGRGRWDRLAELLEQREGWHELRLCDGRGATMMALHAADDAADDAPTRPPPPGADMLTTVAALMADVMKTTVKSVTAGLESTVRTLRTESREEMTALLQAHQDMSRDAFASRAEALAELAAERERRIAVEAELAARQQQERGDETDPAAQREATIFRLLAGGKEDAPQPKDPSQGMPSGA